MADCKTCQKLGRHVRKRERGIMTFARHPYHKEVGNDDGETGTLDGIYLRPVHVFDVSQTDGADLPTIDVPTIASTGDGLLVKLQNVATERRIAVTFQSIETGAFGTSGQCKPTARRSRRLPVR